MNEKRYEREKGKNKEREVKNLCNLTFHIYILGALYFKTHVVKIIVVFKKGEYGKKNSIS